MKWRKLGRVFDPEKDLPPHPKLVSHAANPLAIQMDGDIYRIFFSARDVRNRSSVGAVDIDITTTRLIRTLPAPVFEHGLAGSFFADGISVGCVYLAGDQRYMLFMGWQVPQDAHWRGDIGRFRLHDDLTLSLDPCDPYIGSDALDPISLSYPWVTEGPDGFIMHYGSTTTWDAGNGEMVHVIREATSEDGENWHRTGHELPHVIGEAQAFSRPTVYTSATGERHMWYSFRGAPGRSYRIGYAQRDPDGPWKMQNEDAGIDVSPEGWDSEMIEYPFVFEHAGRVLMLYNGNGFGRTGFGLAELET